nr:MAG TPA: hypothetical protein [Caudoviricetes sp.]
MLTIPVSRFVTIQTLAIPKRTVRVRPSAVLPTMIAPLS